MTDLTSPHAPLPASDDVLESMKDWILWSASEGHDAPSLHERIDWAASYAGLPLNHPFILSLCELAAGA